MSQFTALLYSALTFGATGMATGALQEAGKEIYLKLKNGLVSRLPGNRELTDVFQLIETDPQSTARQALLQEELDKAVETAPELANDHELTTLAQQLLDLLEQDGHAGGSRNISINENKGNVSSGDNARQIQANTYIEKQIKNDE